MPVSGHLPSQRLIYFLSPWTCLFWTFRVNEIIHYVFFCVWLLSLGILFLWLIRAVERAVVQASMLKALSCSELSSNFWKSVGWPIVQISLGLYFVTLGLLCLSFSHCRSSWLSLYIKSWNHVVEAFQLCFSLWGLFWYVEVFSDQFDDFHRRALPWFWEESSEQLDEFAESEQFESSVLWMWFTYPFI